MPLKILWVSSSGSCHFPDWAWEMQLQDNALAAISTNEAQNWDGHDHQWNQKLLWYFGAQSWYSHYQWSVPTSLSPLFHRMSLQNRILWISWQWRVSLEKDWGLGPGSFKDTWLDDLAYSQIEQAVCPNDKNIRVSRFWEKNAFSFELVSWSPRTWTDSLDSWTGIFVKNMSQIRELVDLKWRRGCRRGGGAGQSQEDSSLQGLQSIEGCDSGRPKEVECPHSAVNEFAN